MPVTAAASLLAAIPSPGSNQLELGPLTLRMYGLAIAAGVVAAVVISARRWAARGGNPDDIGGIALWAVPAGVIGARLYHVITDWRRYEGRWLEAFNITQGGLGIPGGVALGVIVGLVYVKRKGLPARPLLDVAAPAIPVAQAIGRLGNWFNQELFGRPTDLPWALRVDPDVAIAAGHSPGTTFHPTFLYEALWNLSLAGLLIALDRRRRLRSGELFVLYVLGYAIGRLWVESLRIDEATLLFGVRVNIWVSIVAALVAVSVFVWNRRRPAPAAEVTASLEGATPDAVVTDQPDPADQPGSVDRSLDETARVPGGGAEPDPGSGSVVEDAPPPTSPDEGS